MLEARGLTKYYGHTAAVRDVSFTIRQGEILGYLGANGAGKSTTVRMLTGLTEPSDGAILYNGSSIREDMTRWQRRLGYVPEEAHLYGHLSGEEYLRLVGRLRSMPRPVLEPRIEEFLRLLLLWDDRHEALSAYSKGMRQKILLAAALLHNPDVLVLDEPFSGLDTNSALVLRELMRRLAAEGKTILFSSHVLEVVEKVCTNVLILRSGEVVAHESVNRLQSMLRQPSLEGVFAQLTASADPRDAADRILRLVVSRRFGNEIPLGEPGEPGANIATTLARNLVSAFPQDFQNTCGEELLESAKGEIEFARKRGRSTRGLTRLFFDFVKRIPAEYINEVWQDLRYGFRSLANARGFSIAAILSLSLGICIATCALSQMNGLALRKLPGVNNPGALAALQAPISWPAYEDIRENARSFTSTAAYLAPVALSVDVDGRRNESGDN